jgi:Glutaredoxin-like domain (DUF836)
MSLRLFRRENCGLCELAEAMLRDAAVAGVEVLFLEDHAALEDRYGWRIPVLRRMDTDAELDWPFDAWKLKRFLDVP